MRKLTLGVLAITVLILLGSTLFGAGKNGANYYVSPHGKNSNPGTCSRPRRILDMCQDSGGREIRL